MHIHTPVYVRMNLILMVLVFIPQFSHNFLLIIWVFHDGICTVEGEKGEESDNLVGGFFPFSGLDVLKHPED